MPLNKHLVDLTAKGQIACSDCRVVADVSMNGSNVKLICPNCHTTLGTWETAAAAVDDITAYVASVRRSR